MARSKDEWKEFAAKQGFDSLRDYLWNQYVRERLSTLKIAQRISLADPTVPQVSRVRVRQLLDECKIARRRPNEVDQSGRRKKLDVLTPGDLAELSTREIAAKHGVHLTTARRAKRRASNGPTI